ncbi:hypothetical protein RRG53_00205 [Mycoplasmopsis cynos]|uniref:hypothetical protein n=2 Tax=Mycoplasmopsis cynos TaxID=171284 RepID=UPI002AFE1090|nr:hypothetical protein [Mycoplasmopsis cynos]WQQ18491.1 hypothetical protein RRG53_00205 [Mycoplasmopsis cynos]
MKKYKKIFSGLGLLSITTLIGAGVVACSRTEKTKEIENNGGASENNPGSNENSGSEQGDDKKDLTALKKEVSEAVENLKNHPKYNDLKEKLEKADVTEEELNTAKSEANKLLQDSKAEVKKSIEVISDEAKKAELIKKIESATNYETLINIKAEFFPLAKTELSKKAESLEYPDKEASKATREKLKKEVEALTIETYEAGAKKINELAAALNLEIKEIDELFDFSKLPENTRPVEPDPKTKKDEYNSLAKNYFKAKLNTLEFAADVSKVITDEYKAKFNKYKDIINSDKFNGTEYNDARKKGLNGRLAKFYNDDHDKEYTESRFIWHIFETIRRNGFKNKIDKYGIYQRMNQTAKKDEIIKESGISEIDQKNQDNPGLNINQLEEKVNKMSETIILIAKRAANLNIDLVKYSDTEKPTELNAKLVELVKKATKLTEVDLLIAEIHKIAPKVKEVIDEAKKNNKEAEFKEKIKNISETKASEIFTKLEQLKREAMNIVKKTSL